MVVLHYTALPTAEAALERLCDPAAEVSAHYLIDEAGQVFALVEEAMRAWHAGAGAWGSLTDLNSHSIGIELQNPGDRLFPAPQMRALEALLGEVLARWRMPPERVIAHSDMAPGRKSDPGPRFDWRRLALQGLSVWPEAPAPAPPDPARFARAAAQFGYVAPAEGWEAVLHAFRLRFRPWAEGALAGEDVGAIEALAARWPRPGA
ncbi:MAG TPA: N-acetylmuramoyl-L-alanine amidase [Paracoccaceae bacterium]|nr:N-acetylmuramoyl-L-alanine amidase [Paracoccaceae bacterium]